MTMRVLHSLYILAIALISVSFIPCASPVASPSLYTSSSLGNVQSSKYSACCLGSPNKILTCVTDLLRASYEPILIRRKLEDSERESNINNINNIHKITDNNDDGKELPAKSAPIRRIAILSDGTPGVNDYFAYTSFINSIYSELHGYTYMIPGLYKNETLDGRWVKVSVLKWFFDTGAHRSFDYVVWIDADAIFVDHKFKIESIIDSAPYADLVSCEDTIPGSNKFNYANTGVMILKTSLWSQRFVNQWWGKDESDHADRMARYSEFYGDQTSFNELLLSNLHDMSGGIIKVFPAATFNSKAHVYVSHSDDRKVLHLMGEESFYRKIVFENAYMYTCNYLRNLTRDADYLIKANLASIEDEEDFFNDEKFIIDSNSDNDINNNRFKMDIEHHFSISRSKLFDWAIAQYSSFVKNTQSMIKRKFFDLDDNDFPIQIYLKALDRSVSKIVLMYNSTSSDTSSTYKDADFLHVIYSYYGTLMELCKSTIEAIKQEDSKHLQLIFKKAEPFYVNVIHAAANVLYSFSGVDESLKQSTLEAVTQLVNDLQPILSKDRPKYFDGLTSLVQSLRTLPTSGAMVNNERDFQDSSSIFLSTAKEVKNETFNFLEISDLSLYQRTPWPVQFGCSDIGRLLDSIQKRIASNAPLQAFDLLAKTREILQGCLIKTELNSIHNLDSNSLSFKLAFLNASYLRLYGFPEESDEAMKELEMFGPGVSTDVLNQRLLELNRLESRLDLYIASGTVASGAAEGSVIQRKTSNSNSNSNSNIHSNRNRNKNKVDRIKSEDDDDEELILKIAKKPTA